MHKSMVAMENSRDYSNFETVKNKMAAVEVETMNCKKKISQALDEYEKRLEPVVCDDRLLKPSCEIPTLKDLVGELHRVFSSDHVNVEYVTQLMMNYKSNPADWKKYAKFDRFRYTRNLVDAGNGAFNIMVLCWGGGHASAIHDHADAHCFMKILAGQLEEVRYSWPGPARAGELIRAKRCICRKLADDHLDENYDNPADDTRCCCSDPSFEESAQGDQVCAMVETARSKLELDDVCYINDTLGLHRVENPSHVNGTVSLHLYCPPFDACKVFDARTGKATKAQVTFWSMYGSRRNREIQDQRTPEDN